MHLSEQEIERRKGREELQKLGINPYPAETFDVNVSAKDIKKNYESDKLNYKNISIAGRLMTKRIMGNSTSFCGNSRTVLGRRISNLYQ